MGMDRHRVLEAINRIVSATRIGERLTGDITREQRVMIKESRARRYNRVASSARRMAALCDQRAEAFRRVAEESESVHFFIKENPHFGEPQ